MPHDNMADMFAKVVPFKSTAKANKNNNEAASSTGRKPLQESMAEKQHEGLPVVDHDKKILTRETILQTIHNEYRYQSQIFSAFREQYEILNAGGVADYELMYDVMHYINEFPRKYQYPREHAVFRALLRHDEIFRADVEGLFMEHEMLENKSASILETLSQIRKEETDELRDKLKIRSRDYLNFYRKHVNHKHGKILPLVERVLTEPEWHEVIREVGLMREAPSMNKTLQKRYSSLHRYITSRVEQATEDFALAELIGLGAIFESVGTLGTCFGEIRDVFRKHYKLTSERGGRAYRNLKKRGNPKMTDYVKVNTDTFLDAFDHYADATKEISHILRKTRHQLAEPYAQRMKIYQEIAREEEAEVLSKAAGVLEEPAIPVADTAKPDKK